MNRKLLHQRYGAPGHRTPLFSFQGFLDGISQPAVKDFDNKPNPGQKAVPQLGVILCGREHDVDANDNDWTQTTTTSPSLALSGPWTEVSSLSDRRRRYLFQLVPEFDSFLKASANPLKGHTADLLEAGRDPLRDKNFQYNSPTNPKTQDRYPCARHTRKVNPRANLEALGFFAESRHIIRPGIPLGPEVTAEETSNGKAEKGRLGEHPGFPLEKPVTPGFDPIVGQNNNVPDGVGPRSMSGANPKGQSATLKLRCISRIYVEWVVPRGGEYFFSPSIPALRTFALA
ncbi:hypothetical protein GSI_02437 [Ganoderma sinense ZZ0214-1]|uniref:Uncharacterized protein n=1 Tax=Ganoderma sinense ZZ0214-1 TaxID=1077348 RepID=A0A2G8SPL3_9APHY|nr:hypothetical protein GSI_02437 [Ganoderma sinense ZZ0214-1]